MQSTGHSSMHALSSTSTQGCAMMYVTSDSSFTDGCRTQAAPVTIIASSGGIAALGSATLGLRHWVCDTGTPALRIADYQPNNTTAGGALGCWPALTRCHPLEPSLVTHW